MVKDGKLLKVEWKDGKVGRFFANWLKDHSMEYIHKTSKQRTFDSSLVSSANLYAIQNWDLLGQDLIKIQWEDNEETSYSSNYLRSNCFEDWARLERYQEDIEKRNLWNANSLNLQKVSANSLDTFKVLSALNDDGVVMITDMPLDEEGFEKIVRKFARPRETFYGSIWDTAPKNEAEVNDTAYTKDELPPHTDTTYLFDSPGLQLFNCVAQSGDANDVNEGATKIVDGFYIVNELKNNYPEAYEFFCNTNILFQCLEDGVNMQYYGPMIKRNIEVINGKEYEKVEQFRFNPTDLGPLNYLTMEDCEKFYDYNKILSDLIYDKENIGLVKLQVGQMLIVNNHRVMHGRQSFKGYRNMVGCYASREDWESNYRLALQSKNKL